MDELQREAVALVRQYRFFLPGPVKGFLLRLAQQLQWEQLQGELK